MKGYKVFWGIEDEEEKYLVEFFPALDDGIDLYMVGLCQPAIDFLWIFKEREEAVQCADHLAVCLCGVTELVEI